MLIDAKNAHNHNQTLHTTCTLPGRSPNFFASCKRRATRPIANPQLSQRPRHTNRRTSACAAGKVDIDSRQDGHLDPKTARSIPATHEQQHTICAWHAKRDACPHQAKPHTSCNTGMTQTKLPLMAGRTHLLGRPRGRSTCRPLLGGLSASRSAPGGSRPSFEEVEQLLRTAGQRAHQIGQRQAGSRCGERCARHTCSPRVNRPSSTARTNTSEASTVSSRMISPS